MFSSGFSLDMHQETPDSVFDDLGVFFTRGTSCLDWHRSIDCHVI